MHRSPRAGCAPCTEGRGAGEQMSRRLKPDLPAASRRRRVEISRFERTATGELGSAEGRQQALLHVSGRQAGETVEDLFVGFRRKAPIVAGDGFPVESGRNAAGAVAVGARYFIHVHPIEDGFGNRPFVVGGGDPENMGGIHVDLDEFVLEMACRLFFQQAVVAPMGS